MSNPRLPPETLDYIVDLLHDDPDALKACCLVSKSCVPRTRKHLFAEVGLLTEGHLKSWKKLFSDPSTSPAHFATTLRVGCTYAFTTADVEVGGWLTGFAHIVHFGVETLREPHYEESAISLALFRGFSRTIKSLRVIAVDTRNSLIFHFVLSSPLLRDLTVARCSTSIDEADLRPVLNPPLFTGSLMLILKGRMKTIVDRLLSIPGGIHFRKLTLMWWHVGDLLSIIALVKDCSHTLESLTITCHSDGGLGLNSVDLSRATRLKDVTFLLESSGPEWVTTALQTITPKHRDLRQISISTDYFSTLIEFLGSASIQKLEEHTAERWLELDRLLTQLWESYSTPPKIMCGALSWNEKYVRNLMGRWLPEATRGGTVNLFDAL